MGVSSPAQLCCLCKDPRLLRLGVPAPGWCPGHRQVHAWPSAPRGHVADTQSVLRSCSGVLARRPVSGRFCEGPCCAGKEAARRRLQAERLLLVLPSGFAPAALGTTVMPSPSAAAATRRGGRRTLLPTCALRLRQGSLCSAERPLGACQHSRGPARALQEGQGCPCLLKTGTSANEEPLRDWWVPSQDSSPRWASLLPEVQRRLGGRLRLPASCSQDVAGCQAQGVRFFLPSSPFSCVIV